LRILAPASPGYLTTTPPFNLSLSTSLGPRMPR
jgi:hypothetical protein